MNLDRDCMESEEESNIKVKVASYLESPAERKVLHQNYCRFVKDRRTSLLREGRSEPDPDDAEEDRRMNDIEIFLKWLHDQKPIVQLRTIAQCTEGNKTAEKRDMSWMKHHFHDSREQFRRTLRRSRRGSSR